MGKKDDNKDKQIHIKNRKASHEYQFLDKYIAGIQLTGTEIKSIRQGKASIAEGYCYFSEQGELFVKNIHISEYKQASYNNHDPKRERKLLLSKKELSKIRKQVKDTGVTIIPIRLFINNRGWAKLEIAIAKGKKLHDKREDIKRKDIKRQVEREIGRKF